MAEYIEREAFIKRLENEADKSSDIINLLILNGIVNIVRDENIAPTADVVEVVRCKDCAIPHNRFTGCPNLNGLIPPENHFCSFGERKESDNNA